MARRKLRRRACALRKAVLPGLNFGRFCASAALVLYWNIFTDSTAHGAIDRCSSNHLLLTNAPPCAVSSISDVGRFSRRLMCHSIFHVNSAREGFLKNDTGRKRFVIVWRKNWLFSWAGGAMLVCARNPSAASRRRVDNMWKMTRATVSFVRRRKQCAFAATAAEMDCTCWIRTNVSSSND